MPHTVLNTKHAPDAMDRAERKLDTLLADEALFEEPKRDTNLIAKRQFVYVQFVKEGYHCFPEAATDPKYATGDDMDVSHLGSRHFHYFYFKVHIEVNHSNRDIEFIQLRRELEKMYDSGALELNNKSCEMISDDLYLAIRDKYPNVGVMIDVSEDNINGSFTRYQATGDNI
jgi:hypothetical protein